MKPKKPKKTAPTSRPRAAASTRVKPAARTTKAVSAAATSDEAMPKSPAKSTSKAPAKKRLKIPAILLEGDKPSAPAASGPGHRYALGPTPPVERLEAEGELPEAYGTKELLLTARDPHWLWAHWDLTRE